MAQGKSQYFRGKPFFSVGNVFTTHFHVQRVVAKMLRDKIIPANPTGFSGKIPENSHPSRYTGEFIKSTGFSKNRVPPQAAIVHVRSTLNHVLTRYYHE